MRKRHGGYDLLKLEDHKLHHLKSFTVAGSFTASLSTYLGLPHKPVRVGVVQLLHDSLDSSSHFLRIRITTVHYLQHKNTRCFSSGEHILGKDHLKTGKGKHAVRDVTTPRMGHYQVPSSSETGKKNCILAQQNL